MCEQVRRHPAVLADEVRQRGQKLVVSQRRELKMLHHASRIARGFSSPENAAGAGFRRKTRLRANPTSKASQALTSVDCDHSFARATSPARVRRPNAVKDKVNWDA